MNSTSQDFREIRSETGCGDTAAAILVLAEAIRKSGFSESNAEHFGHYLALTLKNVLQESEIRITSEGE